MSEKSSVYKDFIYDMEKRGLNREWLNSGSFLYGDYVEYLSENSWNREFISLNEFNLSFVSIYNLVRCPPHSWGGHPIYPRNTCNTFDIEIG
jgi:hypothetical protein